MHKSPVIGLSVGAATLAAVAETRSITRQPVVVRAGSPIDDFVYRVGDPVGIVAPDGSVHTGAALLAEALYELARRATAGGPVPPAATVAYPAHWRPVAVDALGRALRRIPAWSAGIRLIPDCAAALAALQQEAGLPGRGVIAVCDIGAGATTLTLVDAADGLTIVGDPLRYPEFSGDLIDRALLTHVLSVAGSAPGVTGTSAISTLTRLRADCREAKERLSTQTVTTVPGQPAGVRGEIRITRSELDGIVREPLMGVVAALSDILRRNGIALTELVAVASVGGMAAVPAVTITLSEQLRVPVITSRRPALAAATGAALCASPATADVGATVVSPVRIRPVPARPSLAWSHAPDVPHVVPQLSARRPLLRPLVDFTPEPAPSDPERTPWYQRPLAVAVATLAVIAGAGGATVLALRADTSAAPALPAAGISTTERTVIAVPAPTLTTTGPSG